MPKPVWSGEKWALGMLTFLQLLAWCTSFDPSMLEYVVTWLVALPLVLLLGAIAGLLARVRCHTRCELLAAILAVTGVVATYAGFPLFNHWQEVFGASIEQLLGPRIVLVGGSIVGIAAELIVFASITAAAYLVEHVGKS